ncbi:class I SAM-dependent methyltransferase [Dissulfurirhabdus thermomarina]|uniref:Class I SAM-dependent methyltransferase n=1 Tax=Dissulfurirhabdus thermomarina TaxID=1765737 RepID=A0A6N9TMG7_DISTH|nr:class I SAM-dependent methyltransferase [Dissulfurirhabdus thermomarina]NDY42238.1 class I SAM-dependent methyltransferase [Dissulfurirhabdus thermomarina]NMX23164.1 class I SAM-dependent methyltransferase [Dissulfurirhabdus thermomarina]
MKPHPPGRSEGGAARAFDAAAGEYDRWYDGNPLFAAELAAVRELGELRPPAVEIGGGTGRFAAALGIPVVVDAAGGMLRLARERGVAAVQALAERLPFRDGTFRTACFLFSLCFMDDPGRALGEARRVLSPGGRLVLGIIRRDSPLGARVAEKGTAGHPLYRFARPLDPGEIDRLLARHGFRPLRWVSALPGEEAGGAGAPLEGVVAGCCFLAVLAEAAP